MSDSQYILYRNLAECYNSAAVPSVNIQDVLKDIWVLISTVSNIESMVSVIFNMIHPIFRTSVYPRRIRRSAKLGSGGAIGRCQNVLQDSGYSY